ncbi:hypothetical protein ACJW31_09G095200 [Castanea mollissima]
MNCSLIDHEGKDPNTPHKIAEKCCEDLLNYSGHILKLVEKQTSKQIKNNRLRLKTSIEGHDESLDSKSRRNFIELIEHTSTFNENVARVILENAPRNAKYTSPTIQKEILHILASKVRNAIREKIGDAKFCILVDEARDESKREQMAIILRFVDKEGFIKECFFHVVHVRDTTALTLKNEICQGYDGASNMRGEWNGLQALFLKDSHKLQLALVTASREVKDVHYSSKRNDELQHAQAEQVKNMITFNEIETGRGANHIVINTISEEEANYKQHNDVKGVYQVLTSFEFILILHLMKEIMGIINVLCLALQQHSQDLLNVKHLVSTTKLLIQNVISFCKQHEIDILDMNARYTKARVAINFQLQELKSRFCELTTELKYYPQDFTEHEQELLESQLQHYKLDVIKHPDFQNMSTIFELCRGLKISGKSKIYFLIDRLIRFVLTLPISTATTEQAFLAMKLLKTRLRNRMEDELLTDNVIVYIEKKIVGNFTVEIIMDEFYSMKNHRQA